jgi:hypothetical protein
MNQPLNVSALRRQAADALRQARRLPIGHERNDLRQVAIGLLWLEKRGVLALAADGGMALGRPNETPRNSA